MVNMQKIRRIPIQRSRNPALFFSKAETKRIIEAIQAAEKKTSGEIRVHLERRARVPFYAHAEEIFAKLGMARTQERNGVLIFIGLASRRFAILGDQGIHDKVSGSFWKSLSIEMQAAFKEDRFADGIVRVITAAGAKLQHHFPYERRDLNELPDEISYSF